MATNLIDALETQSRACIAMGAPFSGAMLAHAAADVAASGYVARLLADWADVTTAQLVRDALALRLLAGLHFLALGGQAPALAACYPPEGGNPDRAWQAALVAMQASPQEVASMLAHAPQTNEVRRSACLLGGFLTIGQETPLPLRCFELGASAGLNSLWDRFRYKIGDRTWGNPDSPVLLTSAWHGSAPTLDSPLHVVERRACDARPIDIRDTADARRLLAYCWAEQGERMDRLRAAIALARQHPVEVEAHPATAWIDEAAPCAGVATIFFHTVVWQYIAPAERAVLSAKLQSHFARATARAPFFWLRMEWDEDARRFELRLQSSLSATDRLLAMVHPHGEQACWI